MEDIRAQILVDRLNKLDKERTDVLSELYRMNVSLVINNNTTEILSTHNKG